MEGNNVTRRTVLRGVAAGGGTLAVSGQAAGSSTTFDTHTKITFRAIVDAVLPETPGLEDSLGAEHVPGGLAVDLEAFLITYANDLFTFGLPYVGEVGNIPIASPVAAVLDLAAKELLAEGDNEDEPSVDRPLSLLEPEDESAWVVRFVAGTFAKLSRRDRLRAIGLLDGYELELSPVSGTVFEADAGLVGQLVVGFAEVIYYSEWEGYDEFTQPPSQREHANDPAEVQSWRQTGYPGFSDGYAALRGYVGTPDGPLGGGDVWTEIDDDGAVLVTRDSGHFRENDYDTSDYEEPYPEGA
ncbi:hypothetical protein [Halorientalis halophila]|uniref:hypothetical protein n=1 Tax=Halorientalis halophila TaxID=3108499 RepID=UPI0030089C97